MAGWRERGGGRGSVAQTNIRHYSGTRHHCLSSPYPLLFICCSYVRLRGEPISESCTSPIKHINIVNNCFWIKQTHEAPKLHLMLSSLCQLCRSKATIAWTLLSAEVLTAGCRLLPPLSRLLSIQQIPLVKRINFAPVTEARPRNSASWCLHPMSDISIISRLPSDVRGNMLSWAGSGPVSGPWTNLINIECNYVPNIMTARTDCHTTIPLFTLTIHVNKSTAASSIQL